MTCRKVAPLINDFADACLDESLSEKIRNHISDCARCAQKHKEVIGLKALLQGLVIPEPNGNYYRDTTELILSRVLTESQMQKRMH